MNDVDDTPRVVAPLRRRFGVLLIVVALAAALAVPLLFGGRAALDATFGLPARGYVWLLAFVLASWFARAVKLQMLLWRLDARPPFAQTLGISVATDFAFVTTPVGVGGYLASLYYLRRAGASASGAATITAIDQGLDLVFFAIAVPVSALALVRSQASSTLASIAFASTASTLVIIAIALLARRRLAAASFGLDALAARWPTLQRRQQALRNFFANVVAQGRVLLGGGARFLCAVLALTAVQWLTRYAVLWLALSLLGNHVAYALAFLLQVLVLHAALWTGVPAGGGGAELGLTATLAPWVPAAGIASALLVWRAATLYTSLVAGPLAIAWLTRRALR